MLEPGVIYEESESLDEFTNEVDPISFLETIDTYIHRLDAKPAIETADSILNELSRYQIITVEHANKACWVTGPMSITKKTIQNDLPGRIFHLLKSGGEWKGKTTQNDHISFTLSDNIPINIPISSEDAQEPGHIDVTPTSVKSLLLTLNWLHERLKNRATTKGSIGVFTSPYGTSNLNHIKAWIKSHNNHGAWAMADTLQTHHLNDVVNNAIFTVNA